MWQAVSFVVWTSQEGHVFRSDPGCNSKAELEGEAEEASSTCNAVEVAMQLQCSFELLQDCCFSAQTKVQPQEKADLLNSNLLHVPRYGPTRHLATGPA